MKKKIFPLSLVLCLILNTLSPSAIEISFENLDKIDIISQELENIYIDDGNLFQEENILEEDSYIEDTPIFENSSLKAETFTAENLFSEPRITLLNSEHNENPVKNLSIPENLDYTIVDITDIFTGEIISHDCNLYLISNFDEVDHWNECTICGKILNKEKHTYIDNGWTMGSASVCNNANVHIFTCECGHSYETAEGKTAHKFTNYGNNTSGYFRYNQCSVCIEENKDARHYCIKSDGSIINCSNPGKCSLCGYTYSALHYGYNYAENPKELDEIIGNIYCSVCDKYMGTIDMVEYTQYEGSYNFKTKISINGSYNSVTYSRPKDIPTLITVTENNSGLTMTSNVKYNTHVEFTSYIAHSIYYYQNGIRFRIDAGCYVTPENKPPVITNINSNTGEWTTDSTISITGTENYCNTVNLTLKDTNDNIYAENIVASVTNKNWNYEIKPSLESQENTEFILQVKDTLNNVTEQNFYISKVDAIPPKVIEIETLNTDWSKSKDYIFTSSDYGIGNVSNSAISTNNYELATENENIFYKGYTFTGDVYGEIFVPIYMKDGLDNQNVEFVKVSNLDNTAPTIENIEYNKTLHNTEITISANDINEKLNATGSGVTGYAISTENEIPQTFQEENTFNISEAGKYYIFVTDLVGNVTSKEIYIPVQYKVTINPDGGTWKGSTEPQEIETDEPVNLYPEPEKEGYTFKEWDISGEGKINSEGELIVGGDVEVTPIWEANTYPVIFIDYNVTKKEELKKITKDLNYNTLANGHDIGNDTSDNAYYPQYRLISSTEIKVSTNPENNIVYRYFEFCYTKKESHINFNDNNNADGLRPETYTLQLILDGKLINEVELPTSQPDYVFTNLPKYDEQGKEYIYKIIPIISERYEIIPNPENEFTPEITYYSPECSINIPKITTLDGKNGDLTYTIKIEANLFYKDKVIIIPDENITLTDGVKNMVATIIQDKTEFNKEDISNNSLKVTGQIQTTRKHFAGTWHGTFNFKIKYKVNN